MVGTLEKNRAIYALIRTPEKDVYQVKAGNHLGQDFGVITGITETDIRLRELVQDGAGGWTARMRSLGLQKADEKTGERKR